MGLYNLIHGRNPASEWLLGLLNLTPHDVGRFRDVWVNDSDGEPEIAVYTRNGGGNRECWNDDRDIRHTDKCDCCGCTMRYRLPEHPLYLRDEDDDFDCTYATIYFRVPPQAVELVRGLAENRDPSAEWLKALEALKSGCKPEVEAALRPLMEVITEKLR